MAEGFEENVEFFELTYLDADDVDLDIAFDDIAPLLWLRAGGRGPIIDERPRCCRLVAYRTSGPTRYGVLFDADRWRTFVAKRPETARAAFIVTYSPTTFAGIAVRAAWGA